MSNRLIFAVALLAAASVALAQSGATKPDEAQRQRSLRSLDKLAARSGELGNEALALARKGRFEAAEALAREGIEVMSPAPFLEDTPKRVLGEVLMIEKRYEEALTVLEPIYKARTLGYELYTDIAICYAKTGRPELGEEALKFCFTHDEPAYYLDEEGLPTDERTTAATVEATALLFRGCLEHRGDENEISLLERASKLAPTCGAIYFAIGQARTLRASIEGKTGIESAPLYQKAYKLGDKLLRGYAAQRLRAWSLAPGG